MCCFAGDECLFIYIYIYTHIIYIYIYKCKVWLKVPSPRPFAGTLAGSSAPNLRVIDWPLQALLLDCKCSDGVTYRHHLLLDLVTRSLSPARSLCMGRALKVFILHNTILIFVNLLCGAGLGQRPGEGYYDLQYCTKEPKATESTGSTCLVPSLQGISCSTPSSAPQALLQAQQTSFQGSAVAPFSTCCLPRENGFQTAVLGAVLPATWLWKARSRVVGSADRNGSHATMGLLFRRSIANSSPTTSRQANSLLGATSSGKIPTLAPGVRARAHGSPTEDASKTGAMDNGREENNPCPQRAMAKDRSNLPQHRSQCHPLCSSQPWCPNIHRWWCSRLFHLHLWSTKVRERGLDLRRRTVELHLLGPLCHGEPMHRWCSSLCRLWDHRCQLVPPVQQSHWVVPNKMDQPNNSSTVFSKRWRRRRTSCRRTCSPSPTRSKSRARRAASRIFPLQFVLWAMPSRTSWKPKTPERRCWLNGSNSSSNPLRSGESIRPAFRPRRMPINKEFKLLVLWFDVHRKPSMRLRRGSRQARMALSPSPTAKPRLRTMSWKILMEMEFSECRMVWTPSWPAWRSYHLQPISSSRGSSGHGRPKAMLALHRHRLLGRPVRHDRWVYPPMAEGVACDQPWCSTTAMVTLHPWGIQLPLRMASARICLNFGGWNGFLIYAKNWCHLLAPAQEVNEGICHLLWWSWSLNWSCYDRRLSIIHDHTWCPWWFWWETLGSTFPLRLDTRPTNPHFWWAILHGPTAITTSATTLFDAFLYLDITCSILNN